MRLVNAFLFPYRQINLYYRLLKMNSCLYSTTSSIQAALAATLPSAMLRSLPSWTYQRLSARTTSITVDNFMAGASFALGSPYW